MQYIAFDSHKRYTLASVENIDKAGVVTEQRIEHQRGAIKEFLSGCEPGSPVAVETIGNWYWIVDEIEEAGMVPRLVHARKAKLMMGMINKTDKLDVRGLNRLQRNGVLPAVWIPPDDLRDKRELPRTRMMIAQERTRLKNRIHSILAKYALHIEGVSDIFGVKGGELLKENIALLPEHTRYAAELLLEQLASAEKQIASLESRMEESFGENADLNLIKSLPGVGRILGAVIWLETGDAGRFPSGEHLASYAGTTPRVHSSGGKTRMGPLRSDVNRYLKWAFIEAANSISIGRRHYPNRHVNRLYNRIAQKKGHQKAIGAVARHLAEATYWILKKKEAYKEPVSNLAVSSLEG